METDTKIQELEGELEKMRTELHETKEHLKKYTAPTSRRRYYEKHRELEKQRAKEYKEKTNYKPTPEQKKAYNRRSYLRRTEKHKQRLEETHPHMSKT